MREYAFLILISSPLYITFLYGFLWQLNQYRILYTKKKAIITNPPLVVWILFELSWLFLVITILQIGDPFKFSVILAICIGSIFFLGTLYFVLTNHQEYLCKGVDQNLRRIIFAVLDKLSIPYKNDQHIEIPQSNGLIKVRLDPSIHQNGNAHITFKRIDSETRKIIVQNLEHYYSTKDTSFLRKSAVETMKRDFKFILLLFLVLFVFSIVREFIGL
ncbi:MAG: hypothetical protein PHX86_08810 [Caldisericia bacterium]|nr:hypothetical protein [Caldisericia bacterium]